MWKHEMNVLVYLFKAEMKSQKEKLGHERDSSKLYDILKKIMILYFGEEKLDQIWDGHCLSLMAPLTACEFEFNDSFMSISRETENTNLKIYLSNFVGQPDLGCCGYFSREHFFVVSENEHGKRDFYGDIVVDYTKKGDVVCFSHDKRIEPNGEPQEVSYTIAQLSRIKKEDLTRDDNSILSSDLKTHGVSDAVNGGNTLREHFYLRDDIPLYGFDYKIKSLLKENDLDNTSKKM